MCVRKHYCLVCTNCNNQYYSDKYKQFVVTETAWAVRKYAREDGWIYKRVGNGSYWDFCTRCKHHVDD